MSEGHKGRGSWGDWCGDGGWEGSWGAGPRRYNRWAGIRGIYGYYGLIEGSSCQEETQVLTTSLRTECVTNLTDMTRMRN